MEPSAKIKKEIKFSSLIIRLYKVNEHELKNEPVANIKAFDLSGNLKWIVEKPRFNMYYYNIQIDEDKKIIEADGGTGRIYFVDINSGKIINSQIIK
jgi:hypothetical protein